MSLTPYPTLRLKLTMPQALKLQFLPAVPGSNAAAAAAAAQAAADAAQAAANTATAATANKVDKSGDTMTGFLTLNANPNTSLQAATKQYVDSHAGLSDAPSDGNLYGRLNAAWAQAQPFDADLTSLAGASATNVWYYRSAANIWSPVTVGATMTFVGGVLNTTAGGGNVIASGTPTNGQWAQWTGPATIQGVDAANTPFQPLDADLTSLAAASVTNAIYYRSAANTWATVTIGANLTFSGGTLAATAGGTGNVSNVGTPTNGQFAQWTSATTIQGISAATALTTIGAQPLDGDLTSLAAAAGTNTIYYRSATDTWSAVTIGTNLTFSGGILAATGGGGAPVGAEYITSTADATLTAERVLTDTATITWDRTTPGQIKANSAAGGGNVSNSGTPTVGQYAKWVTATTVQGVAVATVLSDIGAAPLASPTFTGAPLAPTPTAGDSSTSIATTAFVRNTIGVDVKITTYTAGSGTHTVDSKCTVYVVELVGGGGGGSSGGANSAAASAGGATTWGALSAGGGNGAQGAYAGPSSSAGTAGGGVLCVSNPGHGGIPLIYGTTSGGIGGNGGSGPWGGAGRGVYGGAGEAGAVGSGSGGGGGAMTAVTDMSGAGGGAGAYVRFASTGNIAGTAVNYVVGAGGGPGAANIFGGTNGGAGGSGRIIVTEFLKR